MKNKGIIKLLSSTAAFMELHNENDFKIKSYSNAIYNLERTDKKLEKLTLQDLENIEGVGKSIAAAIDEINRTNGCTKLTKLKSNTPKGLLKLMKLRGLGVKKLKTVWTRLGVDSAESLLESIASGALQKLKGFGDKTIKNIGEILVFSKEVEGFIHYDEAEKMAASLKLKVESEISGAKIEFAGKLRRKWEIINQLEFVVAAENLIQVDKTLSGFDTIEKTPSTSGLFTWRGKTVTEEPIDVIFHFSTLEKFTSTLFLKTGSQSHLSHPFAESCLKKIAESKLFTLEQEIYQALNIQYCEPEIREGSWELELAETNKLPILLEEKDLLGVLHNHSTYSDGENTLEEMAICCQQMGYSYLGISDHSKATSFYANGMFGETVKKQHAEIDTLNKKFAPFKIFKGIEADILADGALDYDNETLDSFDFVVASIHSGLSMDITKATNRLLTAIANPYTTMLGHMTGRLLLIRKGYPIDHKAIINACAKYGVIIEINAHPKRLDIDWRWVNYALEKGVLLSINPDAHDTDGLKNMYYGVCAGRKGGLTKQQTFNAWNVEQVETYFNQRRLNRKP
ncbi:MAG: DNA polymerase/3'-5' exonuclease PolX [Cyclobacteriaceae bacterium]|nr:DNA polymerase/3'-5' exonuclease PolX [Cyclobacteriaceae bacterium]